MSELSVSTNHMIRVREQIKVERDKHLMKNRDKDSIASYDRYSLGYEKALSWVLNVLDVNIESMTEQLKHENHYGGNDE